MGGEVMAAQPVSCGFIAGPRAGASTAPRVSDFVPVSMSCGRGANAGRRDARDGRPMPPRVPCLQCLESGLCLDAGRTRYRMYVEISSKLRDVSGKWDATQMTKSIQY
jgi:hypothetical protein